MQTKNFTTTILVEQSPAEVFKAINNPRSWWSEEIDGNADKLNEEWTYRFEDNHRCKMRTTELITDKKIVWLVEENYFKFTKDPNEWTGNEITFDISRQGNKTQLVFTQVGLIPSYECYNVCRDAWTGFIQKSLLKGTSNNSILKKSFFNFFDSCVDINFLLLKISRNRI